MIALALFACSGSDDGKGDGPALGPQRGAALSGFRFGWDLFNHRLSHLEVHAGPDDVELAIVGGTSTTFEAPSLADTCDPATCQEFPFRDQSDVTVDVAVLESDTTAILSGTASFEVGADGASGTIAVPLPDGAEGDAAALLGGLRLSTDHPLAGGEACYDPGYGWHVRRLKVALGAATIAAGTVSVPVDAAFEAGASNDPDRRCIDEVYDQAVVALDVTATFLVGPGVAATDAAFEVGAAWGFADDGSPEEQPEPANQVVDLGAADVAGISTVDFRFYEGRADDQGAYLRTLAWTASADGTVNATATNYSPGTQLEDFEFRVEAVARGVSFDGTVATYAASGTLPAALDADGAAVVTTLTPDGPTP